MADVRSGGAYWEVYVKDEKFRKGVANIEKRMRQTSRTALEFGRNLTALGAAGTAAFLPAVKAASTLEETLNKVDVVFGKNSESIKKWAAEFSDKIGRSKRQVLDFVSDGAKLTSALGFEDDEAEAFSKQMAELAIDVASLEDLADADVFNAFKSALIGSHETVAQFGAIINEATLSQELLNMQLDPKTADAAAKAQARFNIILRATEKHQGDAIRSAGSFANQLKTLTGELEDTGAEIGKAVLPALSDLVGLARDAAGAVGGFADEHPEAIRLAGGLTIAAGAGGTALLALGVALNTASSALQIYNSVSKAAQAGTLTFEGAMSKARMSAQALTAAAVGIGLGVVAYQAFQAAAGVDAMNAELAKAIQLADALTNLNNEREQDFQAELLTLSPEDRVKRIEEKLAEEETELAGNDKAITEAQEFRTNQQAATQAERDKLEGALRYSGAVGFFGGGFIADEAFSPNDDEAAARIEEAKAKKAETLKRVKQRRRNLTTARALLDRTGTQPANLSVPDLSANAPTIPPPPRIPQVRVSGPSPELQNLISQSRFAPQIRDELGVGGRGSKSDELLKRLADQNAELVAINKNMWRELRKSPVVIGER